MSYPHHIVVNGEGKRTLSIYLPGERPIIVTGEDPNYDRLLFEAEQGELPPEAFLQYVVRNSE